MIAGFAIAGLAWIAVFLLTIGLACNAVWRAVMPPPGTPRQAGCGSCGYELTTLTHGRCSECGADLLKAGVSTRRNTVRIAGSLPAGIMGWTILAAAIGSVAVYIVALVSMFSNAGAGLPVGGGTGYDSNYSFGLAETYDTQSGEFTREFDFDLTIEIDVLGNWPGPAMSGSIVAVFEHEERRVEVEFADASVSDWIMRNDRDEQIGSGAGFALADALAALSEIGMDTADHPNADTPIPTIAKEAELLIDTALNEPFAYETTYLGLAGASPVLEQNGGSAFNNITTPFATQSAWDWIVPLALAGFTFLIWVVGLIWMIRRRARLIEGPRDPGQTGVRAPA